MCSIFPLVSLFHRNTLLIDWNANILKIMESFSEFSEFFLDLSNIRRNNLLKERKQKILIIQTATFRAATKNMGCNMGHPFFVCNSNNISFSAHIIQMVLNYVLV